MSDETIRPASPTDLPSLASIALAAKASWGYSRSQLEAWRAGLSPSAESLAANPTFVCEVAGEAVGFYQLILKGGTADLDHLWVRPDHMRQGIGRRLFLDALRYARDQGVHTLRIDSDPHAEQFYLACGAVRAGFTAAPIDGDPNRARPQFEFRLTRRSEEHTSELQSQ